MKNGFSIRYLAPALFLVPAFDEGMWTFDNPPTKQLKQNYQFEPTAQWLDHVRLASVRFNDGGSGSFVSPNGLVMTNHHVGLNSIQKLSKEGKDYVKNGFYAATADQELACPDLELNVLESMQDVTKRVLGAVTTGANDKDASEQRKAETAKIEKEESDKTGLRCDVIGLYNGGEYWVYRYKKYKNIKLVFAPEQQIAFYGGDPDNFTYPRYDLDCAFFRVYGDDGKAIQTPHYFRWSEEGAKEGELVFVSGNPGSTGRLQTYAQLEYTRDIQYPTTLRSLARRRALLEKYSAQGEEQARRAKTMLFSIENSLKAVGGYQESLLDTRIMKKKAEDEKTFRALVAKDAKMQKEYGDAWDAIATTRKNLATFSKQVSFSRMQGKAASTALQIVRLVEEVQKPNEKRFPEFRDSSLDSLKFGLFSPAPLYPDLEETLLADGLAETVEQLGNDSAFVKAALRGKTPVEVAKEAISGTKIFDVAFRKQLVEGGSNAVLESTDPLIVLARRIDPTARELRKRIEDEIDAIETVAGEKIAKARFAAYGKTVYPDATFTLRLSFGAVKGYEFGTTKVPYKTTFNGLYDRAASFDFQPPYDLPDRYVSRKSKLAMDTGFNFVCTTDIIGGNSGSPVINRNGEIVGLIFDGNIQSLGNRFVYDEQVARAVAVHSEGIVEAIRKIYEAHGLADELEGRQSAVGGMAR